MARMTIRSREAPMDWERENERDHPNVFNQQPSLLQAESPSSASVPLLSQQSTFGSFNSASSQLQRDSSFASQSSHASFTSGWDSPSPKPFIRDSQIPSSNLQDPSSLSKQGASFSFSRESSFTRSHSPSSTSANDGKAATGFSSPPSLSRSSSRGTASPLPIQDKKSSFDMRLLRNGVQQQDRDSLRSGHSSRAGSALLRRSTMSTTRSSSDEDTSNGEGEDENEAMEVDDHDPFDSHDPYRDDGLYERTGRGSRNRNREHMDDRTMRRTARYQSPVSKKPLSSQNERGWTENVDLPYIIAGYVQVGMNSAAAMALFYILWNFLVTIQSDVSSRMESLLQGERRRIQQCEVDYKRYNCIEPLPLTFANCERWKACMHLPEPTIGRASVSAETFAMIVNSFVNTISYKTMAFVMVLVFGGLYISNLAISSYRSNHILHHQHTMVPTSSPQPIASNKNVSSRLIQRGESSRLVRNHQQHSPLQSDEQQTYSLQRHGSFSARRPTSSSNYSD